MNFHRRLFNLKFLLVYLSLALPSIVIADTGYITVDGETIEIEVSRSYQAPATYPRKALRLEREGYVIIEGEPAGLFDRAAMKSIRKWIYEPSTYDSVPVQVNDVQVKINFLLTAEK